MENMNTKDTKVYNKDIDTVLFAATKEVVVAATWDKMPAATYVNEEGKTVSLAGVDAETLLAFLANLKKTVNDLEEIFKLKGIIPKKEDVKLP
ncbi:hypothetical protein FACS1894104_4970 [Actinomycetota bacterium]|nr:hypothetical protein FACS1894104_4970 [Actinomycetota bacterium]